MSVLAWLLLAVTGLVVARWVLRRHDSLGRAVPFPVVSVPTLAVVAVALAVPDVLRWSTERALSRVTAELAGPTASVSCQGPGEAFLDAGAELGYVRFRADGTPEPPALIKLQQCRELRAYLWSDRSSPTDEQVIAVHVLTHEAMHLAGLRNEAEAECAAVQRNAATARLLGADPAEASTLSRRYWEIGYSRMPPQYTSGECRPGGALDEGLADGPW